MRRAMLLILAVTVLFILGVIALFLLNQPPESESGRPVVAEQSQPSQPEPDGPLMGLNLTAYTRDGYSRPEVREDIDRIASLGANAVTLTPTWYMETGSSNAIRPDRAKTPSTESLRQAIAWIRAAGMKVILKPHVDVLDGTFRGDLQPIDRQAWFRSYGQFIGRFAALAAQQEAELLVIGTELKSLSSDQEPWRTVIEQVRSVYSGQLTYAANWDEFQQIQFWDGLDLIGVDAYFPLAEGNPDPDSSTLDAAWVPILDSLRSASEQWDLPVLLTEVGYPSQPGATAHPWEVPTGGPADPALQERAYRAVFQAFRDQDWIAGINWWSWRADPKQAEDPESDYTPEDKPAEKILSQEWGG